MSDSEQTEKKSDTMSASKLKAIATLKTRRTVCEQQIDRANEYLKRINKQSQPASVSELTLRLEALESSYRTFISVQTTIEEKDPDEITKPNRSDYEEQYFLIASSLKVLISQSEQLNGTFLNESTSKERYETIRLPKIELHAFSGEVTTWMSWYDEFVSLVHNNQNLTPLAKFHHLVAKLDGSAKATIEGLKIVSENYEIALQRLRERFENKKVIGRKHIELMFQHPKITRANAVDLRNLIDKMNNHLTGLKNMNRPVDHWDDLIVHLITSKLDSETALKWNEESATDRMPTLKELMVFLKKRCQIIEGNIQPILLTNNHSLGHVNNKIQKRPRALTTTQNSCHFCRKNGHFIYRCTAFLNLNVKDRIKKIEELKLCANCLKTNNHNADACLSSFKCHSCGSKHHSLLHQNVDNSSSTSIYSSEILPAQRRNCPTNQSLQTTPPSSLSRPSLVSLHNKSIEGNILGTGIVYLINGQHNKIPCRVLLDSGSQLNMLTERIVKIAGIKRQYSPTQFSCASNTLTSSKYKTAVTIKSCFNEFSTTLEAIIVNKITGLLPDSKLNISSWYIPKNINLSDPYFNIPQKIDLLLGVDVFYDILSIGQIKLGPSMPLAQNTLIGWIVAGKLPAYDNSSSYSLLTLEDDKKITLDSPDFSLNESVKNFWQMENFNSTPSVFTKEEQDCEHHFNQHFSRLQCGRYQVRLPFKMNPTLLGKSYDIALNRFYSFERKISRDEELLKKYNEIMKEFIELSHMEPVTHVDFSQPHYVIPHHCVFKPSSSTTKIRVVFDASSKTSSGKSLNELLMLGPVIQPDLFSIALRFRYYKYVFTADITKMYRQVSLHADDRRYHYIIWRASKNDPIQLYQLCTVTYGTAAASFLATRALKQLADDESANFPHAAEVASRDFYVDDILSGANTIDDATTLKFQLKSMLRKGGFELKKWCANQDEVIRDIPEEEREKFFKINGENAIKTLGMVWNPSIDKFLFYKNATSGMTKITKRGVLSEIAQFFDPLGLINPIIVLAKIFMQQLWRLNLSWDESLPQEYHCRWTSFRDQLQHLNDFEIDRHVFAVNANYELHAFSDSSENAYGTCLYIRSISKDGHIISVKILCAKSRVAPIKKCSLPKLELCAAVIMSQLAHRIINIFSFIEFKNIIYWTDSTIVLNWIKEESCNWQTFIANRVAVIQENSEFSQWRYVPSELNPADILSRGALPTVLIQSDIWYNGPSFLLKSDNFWPPTPKTLVVDDSTLERKRIKIVLSVHYDKHFVENIKYYNNYRKLLNVFAYILRFKFNGTCKNKTSRLFGPLSTDELRHALFAIIKSIQQSQFASEIIAIRNGSKLSRGSNIQSLVPFIDESGIIRVGGRLQHSSLDYNSKHPILLPKCHVFTKTLLHYHHVINNHVGPQTLLSIIRQSYWPIHGKVIARSVVHNCIRCFRAKPLKNNQLMADLPELRVQQSRPFNVVGVDFCGPFYIHFRRRGSSPVKSYVAVFVCFITKAIHLELVEDLSTISFLNALKRFIGRRGRCSVIYSDNATNFVGARHELHEIFQLFHKQETQDEITNACAQDGIVWKNIPPRSPHFGGLWEAAVKSFKFHLKRVLNNSTLTFPELNTLIIQIESVLNSRPITAVPENPNDLPALTPGHFIIGTAMNSIPEPDLKQVTNVNRLHRYQQMQWYFQQFWDRWHKEYLQSLQVRSKWSTIGSKIFKGDVVILQEENLPPLQWKLGRVIQIHPGKDGIVRAVTLRTSTGEVQRATAKIRRLPIEGTMLPQEGENVEEQSN